MKRLCAALLVCAPAFAQDFSVYTPDHPAMRALLQRVPRGQKTGDAEYDRGTRALDANKWDEAAAIFSKIAEEKGNRADGALYWKAYCQNKLGQRDAALATIAELQKTYANSSWMNDAKALDVEIRQQAGQPVSPASESNDELKMLALNGLMNSDPERAVPLMEQVLKGNNTPKLKERALFVLSQSRSAKGQQLLLDAAKGHYNPDIQILALRYLAMAGGQNRAHLFEIYNSTNDLTVKKAILDSFIMSKFLGPNDPLVSIVKTEKNPELRREAINRLGIMHSSETAEILASLYGAETDPETKKTVLNALFIQNNAKLLVDLARKENDATWKKEIVSKLAIMHSKEATDYMMEILSK